MNASFVEDHVQRIVEDHVPADPRQTVYAHELREGERDDFLPQCGEPTGGFTSGWAFTHACSDGGIDPCEGDTVVTAYVHENQAADGELGTAKGTIPRFEPAGDPYGFPSGVNTWLDVDPIDGDPDRNRETSSAPPAR